MPTPELAKALSDLGGFALFIFGVIVLAVALYRRWLVLGWVYDQEREARLSAESEARQNAAVLKDVVRDVRSILRLVKRGRDTEAADDA